MSRENHIKEINKSFSAQAENFETEKLSFSKQDYLDYTVDCMELKDTDIVLETASGTCACGRAIAPFVKTVTCLDATKEMLDIGRKESKNLNFENIDFIEGIVENLPFEDESFDIVITRLSFHHFMEIWKPFSEMVRVLKKGGKLVIIDMEAAPEKLRDIADKIETMRDPAHVRNISKDEFIKLYNEHKLKINKNETTNISVDLKAWMNLTKTPKHTSDKIYEIMMNELSGYSETGFNPFMKGSDIYYQQRWMLMIGEK